MTSTDRVVTLQDPLPDTTWIYELDRDRDTVAFAARHSDHRIELPVEPMLGTVGVAPGRRRGALVPGARPVRRQHGHPADAGRRDRLPRRQRRGGDVLDRRRALPPGRGRGLRHGRRGRDDHHPHRRPHQGRRAGLAADRGRHPLDDRRLEPPDGGLLADRQRRARALGRRAPRPAPDGRLPALLADRGGAGRQRRRRQLQRRRQGGEGAAAGGGRLRRHARRPAGRAPPPSARSDPVRPRPPCERPRHGSAAHRQTCPGHRRHARHRTGHRRGLPRRGGRRRLLRARRRRGGSDADDARAARQRHRLGRRRRGRRRPRRVGRESAEAFGGLDVVVANVSALAIPDTEENWQASLNVDLMHTVRLVRAALPHLERSPAPRSSRSRASPGASPTSPPGRTAPPRPRSSATSTVWRSSWQRRASAPTPSPRATPTSRAASGRASRPATRTSSGPRWASTRPGTWALPRRSPHPWSSSPVPGPAGSAAPTSSSTAR